LIVRILALEYRLGINALEVLKGCLFTDAHSDEHERRTEM
jgi:hypothetical protein